MKMVALPSGKQRCIHGPAVNVDCVCIMLPRLPSECELVPLKLKLGSHTKVTICMIMCPLKTDQCIRWQANSTLYANVDIANDW